MTTAADELDYGLFIGADSILYSNEEAFREE